ncbi:MAG: hydrogenase 2 operon protein HybA [Vicinamibacterales bacterium]|nr:hydrogenase 2 operon protein HybA [Vicinamibacterales bacterium]
MGISRRSALKAMASVTATSAVSAISARPAAAAEAPADAVGMLYDTTLCIGCKACVVACADANDRERDTAWSEGKWQAPVDLNQHTRNIIKLYVDGPTRSFVKQQCMHCIDPACVNACMLGSLQKREFGIVTYEASLCTGCRYCQMACPYNIPKFEWTKAFNPKISKCELCNHRLAEGKEPACCEVCPREAVIYGTRADLLAEAHRRLEAHPDRYVPKVYGEFDAGGTQVLYLSHVPFEQIGLPDIGPRSVPETQRSLQHGIYQWFAAPVALYGVLAAVMLRHRAKQGNETAGNADGGQP